MGVECHVGASIGAVFFSPKNGADENILMRVSDEMLYKSKELGRGRVSLMRLDEKDIKQ